MQPIRIKYQEKARTRDLKEYKELFGGDCVLEIAEAFCDEEDYLELLAEGDKGVGPGDPGV